MRRENHDRHQTPPSGLCAAYVHDGLRLCGPCRDAGRGCRRARGQLDGEYPRRDKAQQHVHPRHARQLHAERRHALHLPVSGCEHRHAAQIRLPLSGHAAGARKALRSGDARAQAQHRQMQGLRLPVFQNAHTGGRAQRRLYLPRRASERNGHSVHEGRKQQGRRCRRAESALRDDRSGVRTLVSEKRDPDHGCSARQDRARHPL